MKKFIVSVTYLVALLWPQTNQAQGILTYLDNTSQPIAGVLAMGEDGSVGTQFQTGTSPEGYLLNDLQLLFADATGSPIFSGLNVLICSDNMNGPGNPVSFLTPSQNPLTSGFYTYTPNSEATLESNTKYWLIVGITSGISNSGYNLSYASTTAASSPDGWMITGNTAIGQPGYPIFSVSATAVPEPSTYFLIIIGGALIAFRMKLNAAYKLGRLKFQLK